MSSLIRMSVFISLMSKDAGIKRVVRLKRECEFPAVPRVGDYFNCAQGPFPVVKVDFNHFPENDHASIEFVIEDEGGNDYRTLEGISEEIQDWTSEGWNVESDVTRA